MSQKRTTYRTISRVLAQVYRIEEGIQICVYLPKIHTYVYASNTIVDTMVHARVPNGYVPDPTRPDQQWVGFSPENNGSGWVSGPPKMIGSGRAGSAGFFYYKISSFYHVVGTFLPLPCVQRSCISKLENKHASRDCLEPFTSDPHIIILEHSYVQSMPTVG